MSRRDALAMIIAFIAIVFSGAYGYSKSTLNASKATVENPVVVGPVFSPPASNRPDGLVPYKNLVLRFSLLYPQNLIVKEYDDGTSASTITFESSDSSEAFQVFVIPYSQSKITEAQFKRDVPSGVMKEPLDIIIDGTSAKMFFSNDARIGDTREVWFIKNGFLYEINAKKELDAWLSNIMVTWKFI